MARTTRRLDDVVAERANLTRSQARSLILAGRVRVDGRPATKAGTSVAAAAAVEIERPAAFVSRGGEKLDAALGDFGLDVARLRALDVGASTGGFTDCLLKRGAESVVALDVGYGQLAHALRIDPRVTVVERTNFRLLADGALGPPFDLVTIDASFISVVTILGRARAFLAPDGRIVALVKPQFEAGRDRIGGGGVVRDPEVHRAILAEVRAKLAPLALVPTHVVRSALVGPAGNAEFFALVRHAVSAGSLAPFDDEAIATALRGGGRDSAGDEPGLPAGPDAPGAAQRST